MADFASRYISEIESGKGLSGGARTAASGSMKDIGKQFGKENIVRAMFGGDDIFSAMIRGKLGVKAKPGKERAPEKVGGAEMTGDTAVMLKVIAKNSMALPGMARDMNVLRQNVQKLVKLKGGKSRGGADAFFLKEDERERALEAQRMKADGAAPTAAAAPTQDKEGGLLDSIMKMFSGGFMDGIKQLFSPKNLISIFKKVFLPLAIIGTLFSGITAGFKKYQETGSFSEAIVSGLGGMLSFLTFGLFGEDTLKSLFDSISNFFQPITDTISGIFTGIKDFVKSLFGGKVDVKDEAPAKADSVKPTMPDPAKFASGAAKASGASDEKSADLGALFGAVGKGDAQGLFAKAQEFAAKYPEPPPTETTPEPVTKEGIPLEQAQRNYELNKRLTGDASKALGVPLEAPKAPEPAKAPTPATPTAVAPEVDPEVKKLDEYFNRPENAAMLSRLEDVQNRINIIRRGISSTKALLRSETDPAKIKELQDSIKFQEAGLDAARSEKRSILDAARKSLGIREKGPMSSPSAPTSSGLTASAGGSSGTGSGSAGGGSGGTVSTASAAPSPISADPPSSGSSLSDASSQVAEAQRMESAADVGSVVNAPTTNSSLASEGGAKPQVANVFNEEFAKLIRT